MLYYITITLIPPPTICLAPHPPPKQKKQHQQQKPPLPRPHRHPLDSLTLSTDCRLRDAVLLTKNYSVERLSI